MNSHLSLQIWRWYHYVSVSLYRPFFHLILETSSQERFTKRHALRLLCHVPGISRVSPPFPSLLAGGPCQSFLMTWSKDISTLQRKKGRKPTNVTAQKGRTDFIQLAPQVP